MNVLSDEGYSIEYDSVNIQKDPVGDTGVVDTYVIGAKTVKEEKNYNKRIIHPLAKILIPVGFLLILIGYLSEKYLTYITLPTFQLILFGILAFLAGIIIAVFIKRYKTLKIPIYSNLIIHIKGIGETYRGLLEKGYTETEEFRKKEEESRKKEIAHERVVTEMTIHLAGDIVTKYTEPSPEINRDIRDKINKDLEQWNKLMSEKLREDIERVLDRIDKFTE